MFVIQVALFFAGILRSYGLKPVKTPPSEFVDGYSLNGTIPITEFYVDDTNNGNATHFKYSESSINSLISGSHKIMKRIETFQISYKQRNLDEAEFITTFQKDQWIHVALVKYRDMFLDSKVAVFGSMEPWVEAASIVAGVASVTTVEYNLLTYNHSQITTVSSSEFDSFYACDGDQVNSFDIAISLSSFDHDGLGRYGDPLNPTADLEAMKRVMSILKPGGLLFLTVPVGPDVVVFNLHRRYGNIRLPLLLAGWEVVEKMGWDEAKVTAEANWRNTYEPIFVLRKPLNGSDNTTLCDKVTHVGAVVEEIGVHDTKEQKQQQQWENDL